MPAYRRPAQRCYGGVVSERFHEGELRVQAMAGEADRAALTGRALGTRIPSVARRFLEAQSTLAVAWQAPDGDVWCSFRVAAEGFAVPGEDGASLTLELFPDRSPALNSGPLAVREGDRLGLLFIDLASRHRLRVNGRVRRMSGSAVVMDVAEAFPNCPKYIQARDPVNGRSPENPAEARGGDGSPEDLGRWLEKTDTVFVASSHPNGQLDCSHRGGRPGFMQLDAGVLQIPDYPGNSMFNTLGNLTVDPRAGLCLVDFDGGRLLHLSGEARIDFGAHVDSASTGGTGRRWSFTPRRWVSSAFQGGAGWRLVAYSPHNP